MPALLATAGPLEEDPGGALAAMEQALRSGLLAEEGKLIGFRVLRGLINEYQRAA